MFGLKEKKGQLRRYIRKVSRPSFAVSTVGTFVAVFTFLSIARYSAWIKILAESGNLGVLGPVNLYRMYPFAGCQFHIPEAAVFGMTVTALAAGITVGKYMATDLVKREQKVATLLSAVIGSLGIVMTTIGQAYYDPSLKLSCAEYVGDIFQMMSVTPTVLVASGTAFVVMSAYIALTRI